MIEWQLFVRRRGSRERFVAASAHDSTGYPPKEWGPLVVDYDLWGYDAWARYTDVDPRLPPDKRERDRYYGDVWADNRKGAL